jgi:hypothetical protein
VTSANTGNPGIDALIEAFQSWQDEQLLDEISENVRRGQAQLVATRDDDPRISPIQSRLAEHRRLPGRGAWPDSDGFQKGDDPDRCA